MPESVGRDEIVGSARKECDSKISVGNRRAKGRLADPVSSDVIGLGRLHHDAVGNHAGEDIALDHVQCGRVIDGQADILRTDGRGLRRVKSDDVVLDPVADAGAEAGRTQGHAAEAIARDYPLLCQAAAAGTVSIGIDEVRLDDAVRAWGEQAQQASGRKIVLIA